MYIIIDLSKKQSPRRYFIYFLHSDQNRRAAVFSFMRMAASLREIIISQNGDIMTQQKTLDRRTQYSLKVIKDSLFSLLNEKKLSAITVTDLCQRAEINRGTFYRYFNNIPDLFDQIEDDFLVTIQKALEPKGSDAKADSYYGPLLLCIQDHTDLLRFLLISDSSSRIIEKLMLQQKETLLHALCTVYPALTRLDAEYLFEYLMGGFIYLITKWLRDGCTSSLTDLQQKLSLATDTTIAAFCGNPLPSANVAEAEKRAGRER